MGGMNRLRLYLARLAGSCLFVAAGAAAQHPIDVQRKVMKGSYLDALALYDKMPRRQVTTEATVAAGKAAWALSLPERAIEEFERALQDKNLGAVERARLALSRGIIEYQEGRYQVAILYAEKAIGNLAKESPLQAKAWLLWGESLARLNSFGAAEHKYQKALAASLPAERPDVHFLLGVCQMRLGRPNDARDNFERVPLQHARTSMAIRNLAAISLDEKRFRQAEFWLKKGRAEYPDNFLDSWVDYALLRAAAEAKDLDAVKAIQSDAQKKYPPSDQWLTLLNAAAESFAWEGHGQVSEVR
jgi:tetratricopeptide (TPR) repeat protein